VLERFPAEAVKTNIWGTQCLLDLAGDVELFVNISTDKAANPVSVLGYAKRITERLTAHAAMVNPGDVPERAVRQRTGQSGLVLTAFTAQAASGGPITVTHPGGDPVPHDRPGGGATRRAGRGHRRRR
jgi:FlaA1/EpsC-like NDP-sugar epimerase